MKKLMKYGLVVLLLAFCTSGGYARKNSAPLIVGDPAPEIRFSKWLKGSPVKSYEKDRIYVLEFWATWCGPCIAAMPRISEFARKHPEVTVIAYNVWEKVGGRPYTSALPNLQKFVNSMGDKMDFNVAVDDNDQYVSKNWLRNAGINAIPSTMLVKNGKLIWIGPPSTIEAMVDSVRKGAYNMPSTASDEQRARIAARIQEQEAILKPYEEAIAAKDYRGSLTILEKLSDNPEKDYRVNMSKFTTLLDYVSEKEAVDLARKFLAGVTIGGNTVSNFGIAIADRLGLKPETYLFGVECLQTYISRNKGEPNPLVYEYIATCYFLAGDYTNAVKNQQTVFEKSRDALAAGKGGGRITQELIAQYEQTLKEYQTKASKK